MKKVKSLKMPKFASESDEARWYNRHRRRIEADLIARIESGDALNLQGARARAKLRPVTIRLATEDVDTARNLASRKGIVYQTYIKMLLREALERESRGR